ncbi:hypothetical protein CMUST_09655 [Corynebacterium mustelae]|uniref:Uncharacterized protein n=1 Tax=Corynebacterium mustelae TaxID=571915 RepID=A0A0G3H571_9CORY|nr:hypothetical protein CMUST_09655 [Corynebacterium mustelae]
MIFEYLVPKPFEIMGAVRREHDQRVLDIAVGDVTALFCPRTIGQWTMPLEYFTGKDPLYRYQRYQLLRYSDKTPACTVAIQSMSVISLNHVTEADIAGSGGPTDLDKWREWLRQSWESPMNAKLLGPVEWSPDLSVIKVELKVVDVFEEPFVPDWPVISEEESLNLLFHGLLKRPTPAMVMETILYTTPPPSLELRIIAFDYLSHARSLTRIEFVSAPVLSKQLATARRMVEKIPGLPVAPTHADAEKLVTWLEDCFQELGIAQMKPTRRHHSKTGHRSGPRTDIRQRWNRKQLAQHFPNLSVNQYRKTVRTLIHLHKRALTARSAADLARCIRLGKTRLAAHIDRDAFVQSPSTAQFIAYYLAQVKSRTRFTTGTQDRPMNETAESLLQRALADPTFNPELVSLVYNPPHIIAMLDDAAKLKLLDFYFAELTWLATQLKKLWKPQWRGENMVMRKGDDSSAWNAAARAWDQMRTGWLSIIVGAGWTDILKEFSFGKVPSLVSGDIAFLHHLEETHETHPDVRVFHELPLPWEVVLGNADCTDEMVRTACQKVGIDPDAKGWTRPYSQPELAVTCPTYGILKGLSPAAKVTRLTGWFSRKG